MPRTKFQKLIFALLTIIITVPLFACYNLAIQMGGMSNQVFISAMKVVPVIFVIAFILEVFIAEPLSMKIAFSIVNPREDKPYIVTTAIICSTVVLMCPMMSLATAILFHGFTVELISQWAQNIVLNFPFAFFAELFFIQPIVRFIFRAIFKNNQNNNNTEMNKAV